MADNTRNWVHFGQLSEFLLILVFSRGLSIYGWIDMQLLLKNNNYKKPLWLGTHFTQTTIVHDSENIQKHLKIIMKSARMRSDMKGRSELKAGGGCMKHRPRTRNNIIQRKIYKNFNLICLLFVCNVQISLLDELENNDDRLRKKNIY